MIKKLFSSVLAMALCVSMTLVTTGCGSWETQGIKIVTVLTPASIAILEVAASDSGHPINPNSVTIINKDLGDVNTLLVSLNGVNAPPGTLAKLQVALQLVKTDIIPILDLARVSDVRNSAEIGIMVDLAINEINAIISLSTPQVTTARISKVKVLSANDFKKQFNVQLVKAGHTTIVVK